MIQEAPESDRLKAEDSKPSIVTTEIPLEALKPADDVEAGDSEWKSDKDDESLKLLPWPEENESKD